MLTFEVSYLHFFNLLFLKCFVHTSYCMYSGTTLLCTVNAGLGKRDHIVLPGLTSYSFSFKSEIILRLSKGVHNGGVIVFVR